MHPLPSPAWRGCRPQAAGVEGTPFLLYQSPLNAPDPSLNLCVFSRLGGQLFRLPSTPGPASPVHPLQAGEGFALSRRLLPFHGASPGTFLFVEHSDLASPALYAFRGCRRSGGCGGDPFPFIPESVECSRPISGAFAFFSGLEVNFFGSPPHPARLRRSTLSKQERTFPLSRRLYSSSPKQPSQIAWHTLRNC